METIETSHGLVLTILGGIVFVRPAIRAVDPDQAADLDRAAELIGLGAAEAARAILGHLARELGVTQEEHIAGVLAGEAHLAAQRRRAQMAVSASKHERVAALNRAMAMPPPNQAVELSLALADEARTRVETVRAVKDRHGRVANQGAFKAALADVRKHHDRAARLRREQLEIAWAAKAEDETVSLASARGEVVGWGDEPETLQAVRIKSRDGLATLFEAGSMTLNRYRIGRAFRLRYEDASAGLKVANLQASGGPRAPADRLHRSASEMARAKLLHELAEGERAVGAGRGGARRLQLLRSVAGEGHCIRDVVKGGDARTRATAALMIALDRFAAGMALANQGR